MKSFFLTIIICFFYCKSWGQNTIGLPDIINFNKSTYQAGTQNWDIQQDKNGIIYIGNNEGLLTYNGNYWNLFPLPNKTVVRSVKIDDKGKIFVGGQGAIGYFFPGENGYLRFHSIKDLIPVADRDFEDVWDIITTKEDVFFRTKNKIFLYTNNKIIVFKAANEWKFLGMTGKYVVAQDFKNGLFVFSNQSWTKLSSLPESSDFIITSILPRNEEEFLLTTLKDGIFYYNGKELHPLITSVDQELKSKRIYAAVTTSDGLIAVGTSLAGCLVLNKTGDLIQSFSSKERLINNSILSLFLDKDNNLWMGLDNGISFISFNAAIKHIYPDQANEGTGYAAKIFKDKLYLGTNNGLFTIPITSANSDFSYVKGSFVPVTNTQGQVWSLSIANGKLVLGHHEGAFVVNDFAATGPINKEGSWLFQPITSQEQNPQIISGTYNGLTLFNDINGNLVSQGHVAGLDESSRFVAVSNDKIIWVSHPYRGVYKVKLNSDGKSAAVKLYTSKNGLPSDVNNHVYKIKNTVVVATEKGVFEYNPSTDKFEISRLFSPIFNNLNVRYLNEDNRGNIWFISEKKVGVVDFSIKTPSQGFSIIYLSELTGKIVSGFENIYPYNDENIFIGSEKGFYHLNYKKYQQSSVDFKVNLYEVKATGKKDSLIFGGYFIKGTEIATAQPKDDYVSLSNNWNSFRFTYSSTYYGQINSIEYSYKLDGFDTKWSEWTRKTEKEYTNLNAGTYTFLVKARNNLGTETSPVTYDFKVLPPWYKTIWAYLIYVLFLSLSILRLHHYQKKQLQKQKMRFEEEQKRLQYLYELELDRNEKEIIKLKNEKLEGEINHKNEELAAATMHLVQKSGLMSKMKEEMSKVLKTADANQTIELKKVLKMMAADAKFDENWEQFSHNFDRVHEDFLINLKNKFASLSATDLKLCAYLRMNLSTKEIAQLLNISVRGVEISRYRLRKKLQIPTDVNLFDFLTDTVKNK